jgi:RND family efflux transporter MFP subunit
MKMNLKWMQRCASLLAAGAIFSVLNGCSKPGQAGSEAGHGGEVKTAQITVFGERHEIFAEHRLVVAGIPTRFVTHVTDLKTLLPRGEGPVTYRLRLGQAAPLEQVEKAPTRAGIYEVMLTFPKAGEWQVAVVVPSEDGDKTLSYPPVKVFTSAEEAAKAPEPEAPAGISFLKEQQWKILAGTEPARKRRLVEQLRLPAMVTARPGTLAQVTPPVAGRLLLPAGKTMPLVGDKVEAGQALALIQPSFSEAGARFVEAEGEVVRTKLALEQAELAWQRVEKLAKAEAKSGRELQEAEFALKTARAKYDAALALQATYRQASTNLSGEKAGASPPAIELRAPIAGTIISQSGAAVGEYITADKAVFTVLDAASAFIEAHVPEASVKRLGATKAASYEVPGEPGQFHAITGDGAGRLVFVGIHVDAATRTVPLIYEVNNAENRLRVGQSVNLFVETARAEDTLAIPSGAIVEEDGRPIAFVQVGGETFQKRDLTVGLRDGNWVQVLSGITEGERVVTKGAYAVRLASVSSAIPAHGHVH